MKKQLFFGLIAAALSLTACSSEEPVVGPDAGEENVEGTHFLSVNIVATPDANGSRAEGETTVGDPNGGATYEEGFASENKVNGVRFYFFDADGKAMSINAAATTNSYYATPDDADVDMPNIEKKLSAIIVLHVKQNAALPTQMVAVVNPDKVPGLDQSASYDLDALRAIAGDMVSVAVGPDGAFPMFNSAYMNGTKEVYATAIPESAYSKTREEAMNNKVNVYVERCVAKVRVSLGEFAEGRVKVIDGQTYIKAVDAKGNDIKVEVYAEGKPTGEKKQVYVKLTGWNVTASVDKSYIGKHMDATWPIDLFGTEPWNYDPYFRSYWALNASELTPNYYALNELNRIGKAFGGKDVANSVYVNENAPQTDGLTEESVNFQGRTKDFTKVIVGATLCFEDGTPVEVCKYAGLTMAGQDQLKQFMLNSLVGNGMLYTGTVTEGQGGQSRSLTAADVQFVTALAYGDENVDRSETSNGRYITYLTLVNPETKWYIDEKLTQEVTNVNAYLFDVLGNAQIYTAGSSYYFFPIRHLGASEKVGFYGVVRNHIYDCKISGITGLGTAVFDPSETIWPEKPQDEETFLAAQIDILSWRVVPNDVKLEW